MDEEGCEQKDQRTDDDPLQGEKRQPGAGKTEGFIGLFASVADIEVDGRPVAEEDRERPAEKSERIGDGGGGVAQKTDPLADEHLVHHVVERRDQSGDDAGNGILKQKAPHRFGAERVGGFDGS